MKRKTAILAGLAAMVIAVSATGCSMSTKTSDSGKAPTAQTVKKDWVRITMPDTQTFDLPEGWEFDAEIAGIDNYQYKFDAVEGTVVMKYRKFTDPQTDQPLAANQIERDMQVAQQTGKNFNLVSDAADSIGNRDLFYTYSIGEQAFTTEAIIGDSGSIEITYGTEKEKSENTDADLAGVKGIFASLENGI